jgi:hypothetical protein
MCVVGPQAALGSPNHWHLFTFGSTARHALRAYQSLPRRELLSIKIRVSFQGIACVTERAAQAGKIYTQVNHQFSLDLPNFPHPMP